MENNQKILVVEALSYDYGVGFGYQEFLFNILRYFKAQSYTLLLLNLHASQLIDTILSFSNQK